MAGCTATPTARPAAAVLHRPSTRSPGIYDPHNVHQVAFAPCRSSPAAAAARQRRGSGRRPGPPPSMAAKVQGAPEDALGWSEGIEEQLGPAAQATLRMLDWGRLCGQVGRGWRSMPLRLLPRGPCSAMLRLLAPPVAVLLGQRSATPAAARGGMQGGEG